MKTRRLLTALLAALAISAIFTFWLSRMFAHSVAKKHGTLHYVATRHSLSGGEVLNSEDLQFVDWNSNQPLSGSFARIEDVAGKVVLYPLASGEPVLDRHLGIAGAGLSAHIPDGMRAISLRSDEVVGVAGYLLPGSHVDVLVTLRPSSAAAEATTSIVLQNVQVLTAGQKMQPDPEGKATHVDVVTLLVTPQDAERAVLASSQGSVHFILRNGGDHSIADAKEVSVSALGSQAPITPVAPRSTPTVIRQRIVSQAPPAPRYSVEILRGDKQSVETF
ncbi:MAG: Flp pilus assembly protein CpaB [Acidobacteriaceae bacterium]|nr:Flp pilus assembly protein CpaB [Acidobacteriaceae bacterium]